MSFDCTFERSLCGQNRCSYRGDCFSGGSLRGTYCLETDYKEIGYTEAVCAEALLSLLSLLTVWGLDCAEIDCSESYCAAADCVNMTLFQWFRKISFPRVRLYRFYF